MSEPTLADELVRSATSTHPPLEPLDDERAAGRLIQHLGAAIYTCDSKGRVTLFNEAAAQLWGRRPVLGVDLWCGSYKIFRPNGEPLPLEKCPMAIALTEKRAIVGEEIVIERPDGVRRNVLVHPQPILDDEGELSGAINLLIDITDRKLAEAELASTKQDLELQVEGLKHLHELAMRLVGPLDHADALQAVLETLVHVHGAQKGVLSVFDEASGLLCTQASVGFEDAALQSLGGLRPDPLAAACGSAFATRHRVVVEDTERDPRFDRFRDFVRSTGFRSVHSTPVFDRERALLGVISVHFDEPRKPTAREMQLADMCARHAAYAMEAARAKQALADEHRRKDQFIAMLAHELRNPLAPLSNGLECLKLSRDADPATVELRSMMERQLGHLARLIDDLLDVNRINRGKLALRKESTDLLAVVRSSVETSRPSILERQHAFTLSLPAEPILVHADATRLSQVFGNLLNNAAKYTPPGGHLELRVEVREDSAQVTVRDDGIGIPREMLSKVFEMFAQVDPNLEPARGGLGLGLTIVKRIVEMHGGAVEARSSGEGLGTEFVVRLPLAHAGTEQSPVQASKAQTSPKEPRALRILVVDDNEDSVLSFALRLRRLGHEVQIARDGIEALERAEKFLPDVTFMDLGMPRLNGYDACRRIREQSWGRTMMLVALTGWGQEQDRSRSQAAGFDHHFLKPLDAGALQQVLARSGSGSR